MVGDIEHRLRHWRAIQPLDQCGMAGRGARSLGIYDEDASLAGSLAVFCCAGFGFDTSGKLAD